MARQDQVLALIDSFASRDTARFLGVAKQIAAHEKSLERDTKRIDRAIERLEKSPAKSDIVDVNLQRFLRAVHPGHKLADMVLPEPMAKTFRGILREVEMRERLIEAGIKPRNFIMLEGEPGCGKTMAAGALAAELSLPLVTVQLSTIIGMHMGETSGRLNSIFQEANKLRAVYLFDEFDSLGTKRSSDSGSRDTAQEMARITNGLLQLFDQFDSESLLIASTNRIKDIDPAMRRRFETVVSFALPSRDLVVDLMVRRLGRFGWTAEDLAHQPLDCLSFSYAAMACDDAIRTMVLDGREKLFAADLLVALENIRDRLK